MTSIVESDKKLNKNVIYISEEEVSKENLNDYLEICRKNMIKSIDFNLLDTDEEDQQSPITLNQTYKLSYLLSLTHDKLANENYKLYNIINDLIQPDRLKSELLDLSSKESFIIEILYREFISIIDKITRLSASRSNCNITFGNIAISIHKDYKEKINNMINEYIKFYEEKLKLI